MGAPRNDLADRTVDAALRLGLGAAAALPYEARIRTLGAVFARVLGPAAGWPARIRENLGHALPELPPAEVARLQRAVPDQVGRAVAELYAGEAFFSRARRLPLEGPGAGPLEEARRDGRPVVAVTGHFGNYVAAGPAFLAAGHDGGGLFRPMRNPHVNRHYAAAMARVAGPMFPQGREGLGGMLRHLRKGGLMVILADLWVHDGPDLTFFGRTARTTLTPAELARRHDALMLPFYGIRQPDGLSFRLLMDEPVEHGPPEAMMQTFNDGLERIVRAHPEQWFWVHRRWKPERRRTPDR
jgi:KDO2-lipid IV(A) lauroyltransferase